MKKIVSLLTLLILASLMFCGSISGAVSTPQTGVTQQKLDMSKIIKVTVPGKVQNQKNDITIVYPPKEGEVLKSGQPFVLELRVKSPGQYKFFVSEDSGGSWVDEGSQLMEANSVLVNPVLFSGIKFRLKVVSASNNNIFAESGDLTFNQADLYDKSLHATPGHKNVTLKWEPIASAPESVAYNIFRSTSKNGPFNSTITDFAVQGDSYTDNTVKNGTTYYYKLKFLINGCDGEFDFYNVASATPQGTIILKIGDPNMKVNGETKEIDPGQGTVPVIVNGRTFVPIRAIVENMGGTVSWDDATQKVTIDYNNKNIVLQIGSTTATVNGVEKTLDVAPYISDTGRTMLPLRFVTENLDCQVKWDWTTQTVTINY